MSFTGRVLAFGLESVTLLVFSCLHSPPHLEVRLSANFRPLTLATSVMWPRVKFQRITSRATPSQISYVISSVCRRQSTGLVPTGPQTFRQRRHDKHKHEVKECTVDNNLFRHFTANISGIHVGLNPTLYRCRRLISKPTQVDQAQRRVTRVA